MADFRTWWSGFEASSRRQRNRRFRGAGVLAHSRHAAAEADIQAAQIGVQPASEW